MSFRPELKPYSVITSASLSASITGSATIIQKLSIISYQFVWSNGSSPIGTVGVQVSNNYSLDATGTVANAGDWTAYYFLVAAGTYATTIAVSGASGSAIIELPSIGFYSVRPIYTRSSGTGTMDVTINGKVA